MVLRMLQEVRAEPLNFGYLERVMLDAGDRPVEQEELFEGARHKRDVWQGQDGLLYLLLDAGGQLLSVKP